MISRIFNKLFTIPTFHVVKVHGHLCVIEKRWKSFGMNRVEVLPNWYADWYAEQRVEFFNSLYEKGPD